MKKNDHKNCSWRKKYQVKKSQTFFFSHMKLVNINHLQITTGWDFNTTLLRFFHADRGHNIFLKGR